VAKGIVCNNLRFYWTVDLHVGPGCPNKVDDVHLVQFCYSCMAANPNTPITPADRAIFAAVVPGAPYTGSAVDPLTVAIRHHQKTRGGMADGRISPAQHTITYDWMILALSNNVSNHLTSIWPRIDRHPKCTPPLAEAVLKCLAPWSA
jgi:hypothetical protein